MIDRPGDNEEIQLVAILRYLKKTQDEVAGMLKIGKKKVGDIQDWLEKQRLEFVEVVLDEPRLKKVVEEKLSDLPEVHPIDLVRAARVTADDLLRHYRLDYLAKHKESEREEIETRRLKLGGRHQRDMLKLATRWWNELRFSFFGWPVRALRSRESLLDTGKGLHAMSREDSSLYWQLDKGVVTLCYPLEVDTTPETGILRDYLHAHLRSGGYSWLLEDQHEGLQRWKQLGGRELVGRTRLLNRIDRDILKLTGKVVVDLRQATEPGPTTWFSEAIWAAVLDDMYGDLPYHPVVAVDGGMFTSQYGAEFLGLANTKEEGEQYQEWHKQLMAKYRKSKATQSIKKLGAEREKVSEVLHQALARLLVDGRIPGECDGCQ